MKFILILICLFLFTGDIFCQTKIGLVLQGEFNRALIQGEQPNSHLNQNIRQLLYIGGKFGVITQFDLFNNLKLESQMSFTIRGFSYKQNINSIIQKNRGSDNLFGIEIPLCLVIEFPSKTYIAKKYLGAGPLFNYSVLGVWKYKETGQPYRKEKIAFTENDWARITWGLTYFIGMEDSENQNIRLGINYAVNPVVHSFTGNAYIHQVFISYLVFF